MVDTDVVMEEAINGILVGAGAFGAGFVGDQIDEYTDFSTLQRSVSKVGVGAAMSVAAADTEIIDLDDSIERAGKHLGYGLQGAGWSEVGQNFVVSGRGGSSGSRANRKTRRVRRASTDGGRSSNTDSNQPTGTVNGGDDDGLLIDA